ncbi:MAG: hypothetical protein AAB719_02570 [Patescibacteria group bacterium]
MTFYELLVVVHIIGTVLGVGAATFAEIYYARFNSDDILSDDERKTLTITFTVLRIGLFILVVSGFGFLLYMRLTEYVEPLSSPTFWAKMTVVGVLVTNALLLQIRKIPLAVGAAVSLTGWYTALILGIIGKTSASYLELLLYFAIATILVGFVLEFIRNSLHGPRQIT